MRYQSIHKQYQNKASRLHVITLQVSLTVFPFVFCAIFSAESRVKGNLPQNVALMNHNIMQ